MFTAATNDLLKIVCNVIPEVPAHLRLLWLKREKKISQQVIHCSIVLLHTKPGNWDILDVLEL